MQSGVDQGVGAFVPQCDADGRYRHLQVAADWCWIVVSDEPRPNASISFFFLNVCPIPLVPRLQWPLLVRGQLGTGEDGDQDATWHHANGL